MLPLQSRLKPEIKTFYDLTLTAKQSRFNVLISSLCLSVWRLWAQLVLPLSLKLNLFQRGTPCLLGQNSTLTLSSSLNAQINLQTNLLIRVTFELN